MSVDVTGGSCPDTVFCHFVACTNVSYQSPCRQNQGRCKSSRQFNTRWRSQWRLREDRLPHAARIHPRRGCRVSAKSRQVAGVVTVGGSTMAFSRTPIIADEERGREKSGGAAGKWRGIIWCGDSCNSR